MILSKKRTSKALSSLRGCAGSSAPLLFANPRRQVFSRRGPDDNKYVTAILMDLPKAFDCLPYDLLLLKLKYYGLSENDLKLMKMY